MSTTSPAVQFEKVTFAYDHSDAPVIDVPAWTLAQGQHSFIYGASGSGKSTLLNLICGTLVPTSGEIALLDKPFSTLSSSKRDAFRARHIGVVFQQFNLIEYLSVAQNIHAAAHFARHKHADLDQTMASFCQRLELPVSILSQQASTLSVGQQQRVAIARALINRPELLVVDEPTSALDRQARDGFMQLLFDCLSGTQTTLLFVSHDEALAERFEHQLNITSFTQATSV
ncbi:ATP-binding cassette domain-containing protein [Alteromonas sp. SM 2104]|nr:ATP-binding cassette domain-containing protein [Alteromonas oceanisediminis]